MSKRTTDIPIAVMLTPFRGLLVWQPQPLLQQRKCLMMSVGVPAPYSGRCFGVHVWWLGKKKFAWHHIAPCLCTAQQPYDQLVTRIRCDW